MIPLRKRLLEEPLANRRERCVADTAPVYRRRGRRRHDDRRQRSDGRILEQIARRHVQAGLAAPGDDLDAEDRIAAELEEVVVDADALARAARAAQTSASVCSVVVARGDVAARAEPVPGRRRQRVAIDLAVRRERQRVERDERGRNHVIRQLGLKAARRSSAEAPALDARQ